ncbi:MAG TPA: YetF domain-containing protein, partial [Peptostreptococcaceae bacterium]|nr:YetF domain-containing protein [Peptostreptococcaceae bacterium]
MNGILAYICKGVIVFIFTYLFLRTLSKKSMVHMAPYEIAGLMIFSNVASQPFLTESLTTTIIGLGVLIILTVVIAKLSLINKLTPILEDVPTIIISDGQIDMKALRKTDISLNELLGLLRQDGYDSIRDLDYVILEPQGQL